MAFRGGGNIIIRTIYKFSNNNSHYTQYIMAKLIKYNQVMYIKEYYLYRFILNSKKKNAKKKLVEKNFLLTVFRPLGE